MISLASLREMFDHHYWARDRQLNVCAGLRDEEFHRALGNSFPSIHTTLVHLLAAEWMIRRRRARRVRIAVVQPGEITSGEAI